MKTGIYKITNIINKKVYYGSVLEKKGFRNRWNTHRRMLENQKHRNKYLQNAWNKYGRENFEFEIVAFCDPDKCLFFEQKCLDKYKPFFDTENGYNIAKNAQASFSGRKHTFETIEKIRVANTGRLFSKEQKEKMSKAKKGIPLSTTHIEMLKKVNKHLDPLRNFSEDEKIIIWRNVGEMKRGENHPSVKLTEKQVIEIIQKYASGEFLQKELAIIYNVKSNTISNIINGKRWKYLND